MPIIDLHQLGQLGGLGDKVLVGILRDFLNGLGAQADELAGLLRAGDRDGFRKASHRIKGGAQMAAFCEIGELAAGWEEAAMQGGQMPAEADVLHGLETAAGRAWESLEEALAAQGTQ